jgi:hypothetical protein
MREDTRRVVVDHFNVGDKRRARVDALEEVMRQQGIFGHTAVEGRRECVHVIETLAGVNTFIKEILVHIRDGGGVRVDARVARVGAGEQ